MLEHNISPFQTTNFTDDFSKLFPSKLFEIEPIIPIINILQVHNDFRSEKDINKIQNFLEQLHPFTSYLNITSEKNLHSLIIELSKALTYKAYQRGTIILKAGDPNDIYLLILKGSIAALNLSYNKITMCKEEFLQHLLKLHLLKEFEMYNQCINNNSQYFPEIKSKPITSFFTLNEISDMKKEIKSHKWFKYRNINDYIDLSNMQEIVNKSSNINSNFNERKPKYTFIIPHYQHYKLINKNCNYGTITPIINSKSNIMLIANEKVDIAMFSKKETIKDFYGVFEKINNIISNDLYRLIPCFYMFQEVKLDYIIKKNFVRFFTYQRVKKGEQIIIQNTHHDGLFLIKSGKFLIHTTRNYNEVNELIADMQKCLNYDFPNYVSEFTKGQSTDTYGDDISNPLFRTNEFITQSKLKKHINMCVIQNKQIIGLNEFYHFKTEINFFTAECISNEAELYYITKESFFAILNSDPNIIDKCAQFVEDKAKFYIYTLMRFKYNFINEIKGKIEENKKQNLLTNSKYFLYTNPKKKIRSLSMLNNNNQCSNFSKTLLINKVQKILPLMNMKNTYSFRNTSNYLEKEQGFYRTFTIGQELGRLKHKQKFHNLMMSTSLTQKEESDWMTGKSKTVNNTIYLDNNKEFQVTRLMKQKLMIDCDNNNNNNVRKIIKIKTNNNSRNSSEVNKNNFRINHINEGERFFKKKLNIVIK